MFDTRIGRWMEEDPDGFDASDPNLDRYCEDDPTNLVDPSGLCGRRWQSAGACYSPSYPCQSPSLDPNTTLPQHDYVFKTIGGTVDMSFIDFTPAKSDQISEIVRAIRNNLTTAINDLSNFTAQQYNKPSGKKERELRTHLNHWFLGYQDDQAGVSDIVKWVLTVFQKVAYGLDRYLTVFVNSPVPKPDHPSVLATSRYDDHPNAITLWPQFWVVSQDRCKSLE